MKITLFFAILLLVVSFGCKPKEAKVTGQIFIVTRSAENIRLGAVEVLIIDRQQVADFLEAKQRETEAALTSCQNELTAAEQELETIKFVGNKIDAYWNSLVAKKPWSEDGNAWDYYEALTNGYSTSIANFESRRSQLESVLYQKSILDRQVKLLWDQRERALDYITNQRLNGNFASGDGMDSLNQRLDLAISQRKVKFNEASAYMKEIDDVVGHDRDEKFAKFRATQLRVETAKAKLQTLQTAGTFFDGFSPSVIQRTRTDADGKFSLTYARNKPLAIFASAERALLNGTEKYYWLVDAPAGTETTQIFLSNNNLVSADPDGYFKIKPQ
jgi:hypothetical protein